MLKNAKACDYPAHCVGVTAAATHGNKEAIAYSDSPRSAPTNPLFSAFNFGGGRASDFHFNGGGDGYVKLMLDEGYNVKKWQKYLSGI